MRTCVHLRPVLQVGSRREGLRRVEEAVEQQFYAQSRRKCATDRQRKANLQERVQGARGILKTHLQKQVGRRRGTRGRCR